MSASPRTLDRRLAGSIGRRLPPETALELLDPILAAIAERHARGEAHGAIEAERIELHADGTARLLAVEAAAGARIEADVRAIGELVHEMICGVPPAADAMPAGVTLGRLGVNVPPILDRLIAGRDERGAPYADAGAMREDLLAAAREIEQAERERAERAAILAKYPRERGPAVVVSGHTPPGLFEHGAGFAAPVPAERPAPPPATDPRPPPPAPARAAVAVVLGVLLAPTVGALAWLATRVAAGAPASALIAPCILAAIGPVLLAFWAIGRAHERGDQA